jgi:pilus assembly protein FimV
MRLATDETGRSPMLDPTEEFSADTAVGIDQSLLDATGVTQVLSEDMSVNTGADVGALLTDEEATMLAGLDDDADEGEFDFAKTEALPPDAFVPVDLETTGEMPSAGDMEADLDLDDLTAALKVSEVSDTMDRLANEPTVEQPRPTNLGSTAEIPTMSLGPEDMSEDLHEARTMTEVGTKLDLARAYVDMGDPAGARSILEEVLDEGDESQRQQAQQLLDSLPS